MTRKHFEAIAKCIRDEVTYRINEPGVDIAMRVLVANLCNEFTSFNPSFDAVEFTEACGF